MNKYYVYILTNANRNVLYVGMTKDLCRRLAEHCKDRAGSFTKRYKVYYLVYYEVWNDSNNAVAREKEIKGWKRSKKEALINEFNSKWRFLNDEVCGEG